MKVLFTTPVLEHPAAGGPQLRIENSIKALSRVCDLHVIYRCRSQAAIDDSARDFFLSYCRDFRTLAFCGLSPNRYIRKLQRVLAIDAIREAAYILEYVDRHGIDTIWFGYGNISYPLIKRIRRLRPALKLICDTDSVWSRFILRELPYTKGIRRWLVLHAGRKKEREERCWVQLCDVTTAVSEIDAKYYRSIAPHPERIRIFSNVIDVNTYQPAPPPKDFRRPSIYLAGSYGYYHSPMDTAARWMINEVFPLVRQRVPDIHFYLVGNNSDRQFAHIDDPGITATGKLPSVLPYLCNVDVALVPLKFESGTRFKILEAGACNVPLVSTTLGAEGLPVIHGEHILIADRPEEFAEAIIRLLNDKELAQRLARNCHDLVLQGYSVETLTQEAQAILSSITVN